MRILKTLHYAVNLMLHNEYLSFKRRRNEITMRYHATTRKRKEKTSKVKILYDIVNLNSRRQIVISKTESSVKLIPHWHL